ncbi:MAG: hypothetical protein NTW79_03145 [Candidatus Berkelbacteria bacterium]|nr:hypothetical protein [Candidatus Berkelbacteria bacterium]
MTKLFFRLRGNDQGNMAKNFSTFRDRNYLISLFSAIVFSFAAYYFFQRDITAGNIWPAPVFVPITTFIIIIFTINIILGLFAGRRDKNLPQVFNWTTVAISLLLLIALILNTTNPNG